MSFKFDLNYHRAHLNEWAKNFDSSFFYYDLDLLRDHLESMQKDLGPKVKLWYATKANPLSSILKEILGAKIGIDVAAQGELEQALSVGFSPQNILSTGPSKSRKYLRSLLKHKVEIVVCESLNQLYWLNEVSEELGIKQKALLRVQLEWNEGQSVLGGNEITPFGIGADDWLSIDVKKLKGVEILGLHVFQWGNILSAERLSSIWNKIAEEMSSLAKKIRIDLKVLDLGGGLGIPYKESSEPLSFELIKKSLPQIATKFSFEQIWMELGRFAVGECGIYCTQIIDLKTVRGRNIAVTDGGINHIARPALTHEPFPCTLLRESDKERSSYTIHGPLCTALDKLGTYELPDDLKIGDWLIFHQAGAYGMTESMPYFLCHNLPAEVVYKNKKTMTIRPVETSARWLL